MILCQLNRYCTRCGHRHEHERASPTFTITPTVFIQLKSVNSYENRFVLSRERTVMFVASTVGSDQLRLERSSAGTRNYTLVNFMDSHFMTLGFLNLEYCRATIITKGDLDLQMATYIPGGIRFRDHTVSKDQIVSYLFDLLNMPETRIDRSIGVSSEGPTDTLDSMLSNHNPNDEHLIFSGLVTKLSELQSSTTG